MVELMSKIIRNAPAGRLGEGNRIEQKEVFVQFEMGGDHSYPCVPVSQSSLDS